MKRIMIYFTAFLSAFAFTGAALAALPSASDPASVIALSFALAGVGIAQNFPSLDAFRAHMVTQLNDVEVIRQSLYDTVVYPTAGTVNLRFFQNPIGQGFSASSGNAGNPKTLADTNMEGAGQLPAPQGFWNQSIEVQFTPGSSAATVNTFVTQVPKASAAQAATLQAGANDFWTVMTTGALLYTIGEKPYLKEAPLMRFPPKAKIEYDVALASDISVDLGFVAEVMRAAGRPYILDPGLALMTSQNFNVQLLWPVVIATPSTFNGKIQVTLDGWLFRGVQ